MDSGPVIFLCWLVSGMIGMFLGMPKDRAGTGLACGFLLGPIGWILISLAKPATDDTSAFSCLGGAIIVALLAIGAWVLVSGIGGMAGKFSTDEQRAATAMERLVAEFPREVTRLSSPSKLSDVAYNVKKSDSITAPIIGTIHFAEELYPGKDVHYEAIYHWRNGSWVYSKVICLTPDVNVPLFEASMAVALDDAMHGARRATLNHPTPQPVVAAITSPASTPHPTPTPADRAKAIAEKYRAR